MERREFVGAVLALFAGVAMPEAVRQVAWVRHPTRHVWVVGNPDGNPDAYMATFHQYFLMTTAKPRGVRLVGISDGVMREALKTDAWRDISPVWAP